MADISSLLNTIKKAIYGRDMREALHDSIKAVNDDLDNYVKKTEVDDEPTADSTNPVASGGVKKALDGKADKQTDNGGFAAGENAWAGYGVAIGNSAQSDTGAAVGTNAQAWDFGFAGGKNAESHGGGGAAGENARTYKGFAGGKDAKTISSLDESSAGSIDAIQLGTGTNINDYTMQVYDYQLLANDAETKSATDGSKYLKDVGKLSKLTTTVKNSIVDAVNSIVTLLKNKADKYTEDGGFVAGEGASNYVYNAKSGIAIGKTAESENGGVSIGYNSWTGQGVSIGYNSDGNGVTIGKNASAYTEAGEPIDAIQLGTGENQNEFSMQVYDYQLLANDATAKSATDGNKYLKDVGKLSKLTTTNKTDIVSAINELKSNSGTVTEAGGIVIGSNVNAVDDGVAIGYNSYGDNGVAIGKNAKLEIPEGHNAINAVQLGTGTNSNEYTAQFYDYQLLADDATTKSATDGSKYLKDVGKLSSLATSVKDNIVNAINSIVTLLSQKVDKVNGKGLSANDYTDEEKEKLINLPTKTELNSDLEGKQDKLTFDTTPTANSTNPVTSGGVANAVENLNVQIDARLGTELPLKADKTELADLKLKSVPHKDVSGYPVTLADHLADEEFIKCNVYGSTEGIGNLDSADGKYKIPVTLTGKNVLPYPYKDPSKTGNGISFTVNGDGSVSLTGTATGKATYYFTRSLRLKSGTYTLSETMKNQSSNVSIILDTYAGGKFLNSYSASAKKTTVITLSQDATVSIYAYVPAGVVCENYPVKPQLEIGTTETEYEPYTTNGVTAALDTALGEGEYIDIINKKRYGTDGSTTDITVSGSLKTIDSAKNHISCGTTETPSKIELSYWQDINKVLSETTNAILAQGGDV